MFKFPAHRRVFYSHAEVFTTRVQESIIIVIIITSDGGVELIHRVKATVDLLPFPPEHKTNRQAFITARIRVSTPGVHLFIHSFTCSDTPTLTRYYTLQENPTVMHSSFSQSNPKGSLKNPLKTRGTLSSE